MARGRAKKDIPEIVLTISTEEAQFLLGVLQNSFEPKEPFRNLQIRTGLFEVLYDILPVPFRNRRTTKFYNEEDIPF